MRCLSRPEHRQSKLPRCYPPRCRSRSQALVGRGDVGEECLHRDARPDAVTEEKHRSQGNAGWWPHGGDLSVASSRSAPLDGRDLFDLVSRSAEGVVTEWHTSCSITGFLAK